MSRIKRVVVPAFLALLLFPVAANANFRFPTVPGTATFDADLEVRPGQTLYKAPYSAGSWNVKAELTPLDGATRMSPMKKVTVTLPNSGALTFNPSSAAPVCPDSKLSSKTNVNRPFAELLALCPNSLIGNGFGDFFLSQQVANKQTGGVYIFNGGRVKGLPKIKIVAYSTNTRAGIYTEGTLQRNGQMVFQMPSLTADSSITTLDLRIPSQVIEFESKDPIGNPVSNTLQGGKDPNFVRVGCPTGKWNYGAAFILGRRDSAGRPESPDVSVSAPTSSDNCTGVTGQAKLARPKIKGPKSIKRGRTSSYTLTLTNTGTETVRNAKLTIVGRGVRVTTKLRDIPVRSSQTERIKIRPRTKGRIKASFKVKSSGGNPSANYTIRVR